MTDFLFQTSVPLRSEGVDVVAEWTGKAGPAWAQRNPQTIAATDESYTGRFGITRTEVNRWALQGVPRDASVLEVGCAAGAQLDGLHALGFTNLQGCDISADAMKECPWPHKVSGEWGFPYEDGEFDLVMTSGTFMQIPPGRRAWFVKELTRVSKRWIYSVEGDTEGGVSEWEFPKVMPKAWTEPMPGQWMPEGWKMVRHRVLKNAPGLGLIHLACYLLERA